LFRRLGMRVAPYATVDSEADLARAIASLGTPGILKTRRLGYDGKGQARIRRAHDAGDAFRRLAGQPLIYERFVNFSREVSLVAARGRGGEFRSYPLAENEHADGILAVTRAPYSDARLQRLAERNHRRLFRALGYVGVLCVEYFVEDGRLVANEMAPRVHNSGHWTIEGAETSQFENHVRAVTGMPLGPTDPIGYSAMVNLIGAVPDPREVAAIPGAHLHLYGKESRPGRKLGHVTVRSASAERTERLTLKVEALTTDHR